MDGGICIDFFSGTYTGEAFSLFSPSHVITLLIMVLLIALLFRYRGIIKSCSRAYIVIRYGLAIILILTELTLNFWYFSTGIWDPGSTLPFQLCSITISLYFYAIYSKLQALRGCLLHRNWRGWTSYADTRAILSVPALSVFPFFRRSHCDYPCLFFHDLD